MTHSEHSAGSEPEDPRLLALRAQLAELRAELVDLQERAAAWQDAEQRQRLAELRWQALVDSAPVVVLMMDMDGIVTAVNRAAAKRLGRSSEELLGRSLLEAVAPAQRERGRELIEAARAGDVQRGIARELWPERPVDLGESTLLFPLLGSDARPLGLVWTEDLEDARETRQLLLRVNDELRRLAVVDDATGIPNRRAFDRALDGELRRASRNAGSVMVAMIDVDHFKAFNDTQGHQAGDRCLLRVARALVGALKRAGDLVARYGGEEFVALAPGIEVEQARRLGERLRRSVARLRLAHAAGGPSGHVTVSVGVATARPGARFRGRLLMEAADRALYEAKSRGRDQVVVVHLEPGGGGPEG